MSYSEWPPAARALAQAVDGSVRAAVAADAEAFAESTGSLRRADPDVVAVLLGSITQHLLERLHPDGLDSDDVEQVLASCERDAAWFAGYERDHVVLALLGTLGLLDPEQAPPVAPASVTAHGLLLVATLLPTSKQLPALVDAALRELYRAQTVELP